MKTILIPLLCVLSLHVVACHLLANDTTFGVQSNLRAGVAKVDITPPIGTKVVGHVRATDGIRDPLRAAVLLFDNGDAKAAIVTLDVIGAWEEMVKLARAAISKKTGTPISHILVAASHNHSGPGYSKDSPWGKELIEKLASAAEEASTKMRRVTIGYSEDKIEFNINRRKTINGRAVVRLNKEGPCDHRVKVLRFDDGRSLTPLAVVMHAVCHPCVFTWGDNATPPYPKGYPRISADFPGEAQTFVETVYGNKTHTLFLQGCAGDIRPNLPGYPYRCGNEADIQWTGRNLGCAVVRALSRSVIREELAKRKQFYQIKAASSVVMLPGKEGKVRAEMQALKIGPYLLLTMPGEPMVEYGFKIEKAIADRAIPIVVGYANGNIGYIPTTASYKVGGYEPGISKLSPEAEPIILKELDTLANRVVGDVFESFSKHPKKSKGDKGK